MPDDRMLIEAQAFDDPGGWIVDAQFMDQVGSGHLLAHGWGHPVADARTRVFMPHPGRWRLWVRTRDWCAPAPGSPGAFAVSLDGARGATVFGTEGATWAWQDGGVHDLPAGAIAVALHDHRGFDARCDALALLAADAPPPPDDGPELLAWRLDALGLDQDCDEESRVDLVVVGAGVAGMCAAVRAARGGLRVALLESRDHVGGNSSPECRVHMSSVRNTERFPRLGDVVGELETNAHGEHLNHRRGDGFAAGEERRRAVLAAESRIDLRTGCRLTDVVTDGVRIASVVATDVRTSRRTRFLAPLFIDASGDGNLGVRAGADHHVGREARGETGEERAPEIADRQVLGATLHWFAEDAPDGVDTTFPDCPWALPITEETCQHITNGPWNWEAGFRRDMVADAEGIRDLLLRATYGNWAFQVNRCARRADYAGKRLAWVGHVLAKRESRRLLGDVVYSQNDIEGEDGRYPDECVGSEWGIDVHVPDPELERRLGDDCFRSVAEHFKKAQHPMRYLPYRCFHSRNVANLFMAGRCASMTHLAHAYFRNQRTTGMMGEVVGLAAVFALAQGCSPREIYTRHWDRFREVLDQPT